MNRRLLALAVCLALAGPALLSAADWPQWRGPNRDDISKDTGLLKTWPAGGPKLRWTCETTGRGYSGPAVVGDRLYILGSRDEKTDLVICLDTNTGLEVWATEFAPFFENGWGGGPRGTPTVADGLVYALGPRGDLVCVDARTGQKRWQKSLSTNMRSQMMGGWGYSESPLIDGDRLVYCPGGAEGTMAALNKQTGDVVWRSKELTDKACYASIVVSEAGGVKQYVTQTENAIVGVAANDGRLLWRHPVPEFRTAVIPTPVVSGDLVFATAGYGVGATLLKLSAGEQGGVKAEKVYGLDRDMVNHHGGVVLLDGHVYGYSDRLGWVCLELPTGKVVWEEKTARSDKGLEKGSITYADGFFYCYGERTGNLVRIEATTAGWKEAGRFALPRKTSLPRKNGAIWTHPVVANGKLYLRDLDLLFCFDLKDPRAAK
jgi:outer membrane protein assembly factor BamB